MGSHGCNFNCLFTSVHLTWLPMCILQPHTPRNPFPTSDRKEKNGENGRRLKWKRGQRDQNRRRGFAGGITNTKNV